VNEAVAIAADADPDQWVVDRLADARKQVMHCSARGDKATAERWKRAEKCLDYALAMFLSTVKAPELPEDKTAAFARNVLYEIAKTSEHGPSRIEAVKMLLELEGRY
jgi:hypothetical protein